MYVLANMTIVRTQALSHHNTVLHQLLKPISRHDFERLANQQHSGQKLRAASRWDQFIASKGVIADETIQLNSSHALKRGAPLLRKIEYQDKQTGRLFTFLTNNFQLAATTIAAIYKDRWQVELFFKAVKQNLKIKAFLGRSKNAVLTQVWIAMIAYLLVSFARHMAQEGWTVQRLLRVIQVNLFEIKTLE